MIGESGRWLQKLGAALLLTQCLLLAGCLPPAFTAISLVGDGISYVFTGRSVTDHGISIAMKEDCALFRFVKGGKVCRPMKKDDPLYDMVFSAVEPEAKPAAEPARYLVMVPSLNNRVLAEFARDLMQPRIVSMFTSRRENETYYHLVTGPVAKSEIPAAEAAFRHAGFTDVWSARMYPNAPAANP